MKFKTRIFWAALGVGGLSIHASPGDGIGNSGFGESLVKILTAPEARVEDIGILFNNLTNKQLIEIEKYLFNLVEDSSQPKVLRRRAFHVLWEVKNQSSGPISNLLGKPVSFWFSQKTVRDGSLFSVVPVKQIPGMSIMVLSYDWGGGERTSVYFLLNTLRSKDSFLKEIEVGGDGSPEVTWIVEIALGEDFPKE